MYAEKVSKGTVDINKMVQQFQQCRLKWSRLNSSAYCHTSSSTSSSTNHTIMRSSSMEQTKPPQVSIHWHCQGISLITTYSLKITWTNYSLIILAKRRVPLSSGTTCTCVVKYHVWTQHPSCKAEHKIVMLCSAGCLMIHRIRCANWDS